MVVLFFILGAILGSFYLVIGKRLPLKENVVTKRSRCDSCLHPLSWWELIPFFSFIFLRGKCHHCHKKISFLHFLVELICALLFMFGYIYYGFSYNLYIYLIIVSLLIIIFISDFSYYIILDSPLVVSIILIFSFRLYYLPFKENLIYLLSGLGLFFSMYLIKLIGDFAFKKESLGGGDIKFAFVMGQILGFRLGLCALILSTFLALPYSCASLMLKKNNEVPLGPFLVSSLFIIFLFIDKFNTLLEVIFINL